MATVSEFTHSYRAVTENGKRRIETSIRVPDPGSPWGFVVQWLDVEELVNEEIVRKDGD